MTSIPSLAGLLGLATPVRGQAQPWENAIAKVTAKTVQDQVRPSRRNQGSTAYLIASAHVVAGDQKPILEFAAVAGK